MAEYIEREAAFELLSAPITMSMCLSVSECYNKRAQREIDLELIKSLPAADVRPVVMGRWGWDENGMDWGIGAWRCSVCHSRPETTWQTMTDIIPLRWSGSHYCPNCGARMEGFDD